MALLQRGRNQPYVNYRRVLRIFLHPFFEIDNGLITRVSY